MPSIGGGTIGIFQLGTLFGTKEDIYGVDSLLLYAHASDGTAPEADANTGNLSSAAANGQAILYYNDSPQVSLTGLLSASVSEEFTDYLMFKADGDSVWVPLMSLNWDWAGATKRNDGKSFQLEGEPTQPPAIVVGKPASTEPEWGGNIPNPPVWQPIPGL